MLHDHPVFALCTSQLHNPEILESVTAFVNEAHARGYSVLVFNAALDRYQSKTDITSCSSVFELIPFRIVDMIVLMNDTLNNPVAADALAALVSLGYSETESTKAIMAVDGHETLDSGSLLSLALKTLYGK